MLHSSVYTYGLRYIDLLQEKAILGENDNKIR